MEVGFANLAFGFMALLAVFGGWGVKAQALVLLGYALYLFQAAMLHLYRYLTDETRSRVRLYRAVLLDARDGGDDDGLRHLRAAGLGGRR